MRQFVSPYRCAAALLAVALLGATPPPQPAGAPAVSIRAMLFNNRTGGLSGDVVADTSRLGNVPAGDYASTATLVVVRVAFAKDRDYPSARVRLVATAGRGRVLLDRTQPVGAIGPDNVTHVGFWLSGTGCEPLALAATLTTPGPSATARVAVPFTCHE